MLNITFTIALTHLPLIHISFCFRYQLIHDRHYYPPEEAHKTPTNQINPLYLHYLNRILFLIMIADTCENWKKAKLSHFSVQICVSNSRHHSIASQYFNVYSSSSIARASMLTSHRPPQPHPNAGKTLFLMWPFLVASESKTDRKCLCWSCYLHKCLRWAWDHEHHHT